MNTFTLVFLLALGAAVALQLWLDRRQVRHVRAHRTTVPPAFADSISPDAHRKAADYTVAKVRLGMVEQIFGALVLLGWTLAGGLNLLDGLWRSAGLGPVATGVGVLVSLFVIGALIELPLAAWRVFRVEQRHGFNRSTPGLFLSDTLKQGLLALLFGAPLAAVVLWLMGHAGALWWLYAWAVWMGFTLLMLWAFPTFIAPLFNRFTPLADQALAERIRRLLERCGFQAKEIFVMDGSKRSSHGNAYFTGIGNQKRIVFFDTLINQLTPEEIEAVLAHELGHFRHHHIRRRFLVIGSTSLLGLALLGWLMGEPWFYTGLGVGTPSLWTALALFLLVAPVFSLFAQPLMAAFMRRHEFQADDFAATQTGARDLIRALVKLYRENASTLTPDPLYSAFHDSHPPAPVRVQNLSGKLADEGP
ncbi:MAG: M48 family metallopeptidase [Gammaproteobacteria bacterium]|nr:M48 family metallopeptidase [Gammaproteobacteria bacterium]